MGRNVFFIGHLGGTVEGFIGISLNLYQILPKNVKTAPRDGAASQRKAAQRRVSSRASRDSGRKVMTTSRRVVMPAMSQAVTRAKSTCPMK
ncbi:hypothetical protein D3C86_1434930 [compost metagenome]